MTRPRPIWCIGVLVLLGMFALHGTYSPSLLRHAYDEPLPRFDQATRTVRVQDEATRGGMDEDARGEAGEAMRDNERDSTANTGKGYLDVKDAFETLRKDKQRDGYDDARGESKDEDASILDDGFSTALGLASQGSTDLRRSERVTLRGAILFQKFIAGKQNDCKRGMRYFQMIENHKYGIFSQIFGLAHSLLEALAHDYVFVWDKTITFYADAQRCPSRSFECFFLPISKCKPTEDDPLVKRDVAQFCAFEKPRMKLHNQAFRDEPWIDIVPLLRTKAGLDVLNRPDLFGPHFFLRECLRYVTRPNPALKALIKSLLQPGIGALAFVPATWKPFTSPASRIAVHVRTGDKQIFAQVISAKYYLDHVKLYAYGYGGTGTPQVLLSSDDDAAYEVFKENLPAPSERYFADMDRIQRQGRDTVLSFISPERFGSSGSLMKDNLKKLADAKEDAGMLLLAQAMIFSSSDIFVGYFWSNVATAIHLFMGALRHTSVVPAYDILGSPFPACHILSKFPLQPMSPGECKALPQ